MKKLVVFTSLLMLVGSFILIKPGEAIDAVASFGKVQGVVQVLRQARKIPGRPGLILNDQDVVLTGSRSKVTIIFRDGSEVRLFQDTRFIIEKSEESSEGSRRFFNNFKLKIGSFWGKFTKGRQHTKVKTPTATIGIKGTNVTFSQKGDKLDVALSSGLISVENEDESIELQPGNMIEGITKTGKFSDKVKPMPFRIQMKPDHLKINIPKRGRVEEVSFTLQMIDSASGQNIAKSGIIYFSKSIDKINFPKKVKLNSRGYARVTARINPFVKADYKNGQATVTAVIDSEKYMNVGAGQATLTYDVPKKMSRTIRVDVNSGAVTQ